MLHATSIANLASWPEADAGLAIIRGFGREEFSTILHHYDSMLKFPSDEILEEWLTLKTVMYRRYGKEISQMKWTEINKALRPLSTVDKALSIIDLMLSIPATSSANEKDFSIMSLVKTNRKSWLNKSTFCDMMVVNRETPDIKNYNPRKMSACGFQVE